MRPQALWTGLLAFAIFAAPVSAQTFARSPRELYDSLNALRVDPAAVYSVRQLELRRADARITFAEGTLAFLAPLDGKITGAVFTGSGHALCIPRDAVEKQQLAHFLGAPLVDQEFRTGYFRFTDPAAEELLRQLREQNAFPHENLAFVSRWDEVTARLNPPHSLRIVADWVSENHDSYFSAVLDGATTGPFDLVLDARREESFSIGQPKTVESVAFYDLWTAYRPAGFTPPPVPFRALHYSIDSSVLPARSLEGAAAVSIRAERGGERMVVFELSRSLAVDSVENEKGQSLAFFQNEGLNKRERSRRGNDALAVVLDRIPRKNDEFLLRIRYRGSVFSDAGNGVIFVGDRGSWYPHLGGTDEFAPYELSLRWPRHLRLVATGTRLEEREDGEFSAGRWKSEKPIAVAGFNLGDYSSAAVTEGGYSVEVFANRQLEQGLRARIAAPDLPADPFFRSRTPFGIPPAERLGMPAPVPSPADALRQFARDVSSSIRFYETYNGPFPYPQLNVSQIPGTFGQGWPGLLYISTLSFLPAGAQQRAGLNEAGREHFSELVPFHEVAHQWWGNIVGWRSYRDQWINEAFANYLALLFADSQKKPGRALHDWLKRYKTQLVTKASAEEFSPGDTGPLVLGNRLGSSKSPAGFEQVIYSKGAWVIHMLRMMLRQPAAKNPDARFIALLHTLQTKYAFAALTTADLQREVEAVMTPAMDIEGGRSMDWFFEDWVRGVGIPHYRVEFSVKQIESGYLVRGKLRQSGVPRGFAATVPLYARFASGRTEPLGAVTVSGEETSFHFVTPNAPRKLLIDPQMTLLCVTE